MKKELLREIIAKKEKKLEFAIITNLDNGGSCIFEKDQSINKSFEKYQDKIISQFENKKNGIIEGTNIFVENYIRPIKVIIVGAVHIAQYLVNFSRSNVMLYCDKIFIFWTGLKLSTLIFSDSSLKSKIYLKPSFLFIS